MSIGNAPSKQPPSPWPRVAWRRVLPFGLLALGTLSLVVARAHASSACTARFSAFPNGANQTKDNETGLTWLARSNIATANGATAACNDAGFRLPSVLEMHSIIDESTGNIAVQVAGSKPANAIYWTSMKATNSTRFHVKANGEMGWGAMNSVKHRYYCVK